MTASSAPPPAIPEHEYLEFIASGGFGDVFLYRDNIGREVAIKVLRLAALTPATLEGFQREAARMANIRNRFVVTVHRFGIADDGRPYIAMEHCPTNLGRLASSSRLSVTDVLRYSIQVCSAIEAAHQEGLFHRDVKPANVLMTHDGTPALTDFGIAGGRDVHDDTGGLSLRYAAPEVIEGISDGDELCDVYSLGATMYTLLAGRAPFHAPAGDNSEEALVSRTLNEPPEPIGRHDVPQQLERVIRQALSRDRTARFATAADLARTLQQVEVELGFSATHVPLGAPLVPPSRPAGIEEDEDGTRFAGPQRVDPTGSPSRPPKPAPVPPPDAPSSTSPRAVGPKASDQTRIREGRQPDQEDGRSPEVLPEAADPVRGWSSRWYLVVGTLTLLVGVLVVAGLRGSDDPGTAEPVASESATPRLGADSLFSQATTPSDVAVARQGDSIVVTWDENSAEGVSYVVAFTAGPRAGTSETTTETRLSVPDDDSGAQVCAEVLAVLGSRSSEPSREACTR